MTSPIDNPGDPEAMAERSLTRYADLISRLLGSLAGLAAIMYLLGFIITNSYLLQYGFFTFQLLQARYIASGFIFIVLSLVILAEPLYESQIISHLLAAKKPISSRRYVMNSIIAWLWLVFVILAFSVFVCVIPASALAGSFGSVSQAQVAILGATDKAIQLFLRLLVWSSLVFLAFKWITWYLIARVIGRPAVKRRSGRLGPSFATFTAMVGFPWLILTLVYFGVAIYPLIPAAFGGGEPMRIRLVGEAAKMQQVQLMGIAASPSQLSPQGFISEPVWLLDQSEKQYFILVRTPAGGQEAVVVDKDMIQGAIFPAAISPSTVASSTVQPLPTLTSTSAPTPQSTASP